MRHGYTPHGHRCCDLIPSSYAVPNQAVARCGGAGVCPECSKSAALLHRVMTFSDWPENVPIPISIWEEGFVKIRMELETKLGDALELAAESIDILLKIGAYGLHESNRKELHGQALALLKRLREQGGSWDGPR